MIGTLLSRCRQLYVVGEPKSFRSSPAMHARTDMGVVIVRPRIAQTELRPIDDESYASSSDTDNRRRLPSYADAQMWQGL